MTPDHRPGPVRTTDVAAAATALRSGRLVAFPTETVYGLGAAIDHPDAVARIFDVKGRPAEHPLIVHLADADALDRHAAAVPAPARRLAAALWPGPLTLVLARSPAVPDVVTGGRDTVGLRVPAHPVAAALLAAVEVGVAAPSANRFGRVSPTSADHVMGDLDGEDVLVLDGGSCTVGVESTIVDCSGAVPTVLRVGGVSMEALAEVLGAMPARPDAAAAPRAPGMLPAHYAPTAAVVPVGHHVPLVDVLVALATPTPEGVPTIGVLAPTALDPAEVDALDAHGLGQQIVELEPGGAPERFAQVLYDRLRQADRLGLDVLVVRLPGDDGVGLAVADRLRRAARGSGGARHQQRLAAAGISTAVEVGPGPDAREVTTR
ncbi:MAG: threonylcarbamoyl-AMP synthase [Acidimicrobiia bacterium]|nr:threonylcarbamoyl-AMP synthase [Acidimicrobiia bacterium]